jgi:hypothetical protein
MSPYGEIPVPIPSALMTEVQAIADEEHRPVPDVLRDLVEHALCERRLKSYAGEVRRKGRIARATAEMSAAELQAITSAEMDPRHAHLDAELK